MTKGIADLSDHLFAQMARLDNPNLTNQQIEAEAQRAVAMVAVSDQIINGAKISIAAATLFANQGDKVLPHLPRIARESPASATIQIEKAKS